MLSEEYIYNHPTFVYHKKVLEWELKYNNININNIDEFALRGIKLVLGVDRLRSKRALNYIRFYAGVDASTMFRIFLGKELSQIIYNISDAEDSVIDYFGWVTLAIIFGVRI
jgi:hypothetical protein